MVVVKAGTVFLSLLAMTTNAPAAVPLYPLVSGWEQWFRVDSQASIRDGNAVVSGTVWNTSDWSARRVQLLVEGLDASGKPVSQRVVWLGLDLPRGTHAYFEVPMPASVSYRVSVFAFERKPR
jgi:hypothetical protein